MMLMSVIEQTFDAGVNDEMNELLMMGCVMLGLLLMWWVKLSRPW